jgi:MerR family transcriptional regulator, repressor of the yfmOP operon
VDTGVSATRRRPVPARPDPPASPDSGSSDDRVDAASLRIGEVAEQVAVSTRTIRYYEQVGLLEPSDRSPGGTRRYYAADVARLQRIRDLQATMGFDLDQIRTILAAEDRLSDLRDEYGEAIPLVRRNEILLEAMDLNTQLEDQVHAKLDRLAEFLDDLERKSVRYHQLADERGLTRPPPSA